MGSRFQDRVWRWAVSCFGSVIPCDKIERGDRLIEEVFELLQAAGYPEARVDALKRYVYDRPVGELFQETGSVMVTLGAFSQVHDIDMHEAGEVELERVWSKIDQIRAKQASKPVGSALPGTASIDGSPLLEWAIDQWKRQVGGRPLRNIHRRSLDDVWRQVIRWAGGDPLAVIGPAHDELLANAQLTVCADALDQIMEQVQVFASTYSLVDGRFDDGSKMEQSNEEKAILRSMLTRALGGGA